VKSHKRIMVVDDEERIRRILEVSLQERGYEVVPAASAEEAAKKLDGSIDLILTDLKMPGESGLRVLEAVRERRLEVPTIVMTAYGSVESAVEAMKQGAFDYVTKPFDLDEIDLLVERGLCSAVLARENQYLREQHECQLESMVGKSDAMQKLFDQIQRVAPSDASVLVTGETGTGKELVARALHTLSRRRGRLFVAVNCSSVPQDLFESEMFGHIRGAFTGASADRLGRFELADGGTLFLDEISEMRSEFQAKLLRVLEERRISPVGSSEEMEVDVRVVAASNRNLEAAVSEGRFREDLYYRLNVIALRLPPLRERAGDVALLARGFLQQLAARSGGEVPAIEPDALVLLESYAWPGNVRELRNVCERLSVLGGDRTISADLVFQLVDIQRRPSTRGEQQGTGTLAEGVRRGEVEAIRRALEQASGSKSRAASILEVSERTLWYKLKKYRDDL